MSAPETGGGSIHLRISGHRQDTGGGAFVESPGPFKEEKLRQSYPISDSTGVLAYDYTAIGWQAASSDFTDIVVAFAICGSR